MKIYLLIGIYFVVLTSAAFSQREYSNWYFGNHAGVTFNTSDNEPRWLSGSTFSQFEGCATISDVNGNILLYSTGEFVFNKFGTPLNIGNPLSGHQSSSQASIIVPKPGSSNLYYLFTADAGEYTGSANRGIHYSVIDIQANLGHAGFVEFNKQLVKPACEQLTAVYHANGVDLWVVARGWKNNNFYSWLLTKDGIVDTVVSSIGFTRSNDYHSIGCMKFSPLGNIAVCPVYDEQFFELYRFDNKSGEFFSRLEIDMAGCVNLYGTEFSQNGNFIYISNSKNSFGNYAIYQFDINDYNKSSIEASSVKLVERTGHIGTLQRAINNKIYIAPLNEPSLHSIERPNNHGTSSGYTSHKVPLNDSLSQLGLPQVFSFTSGYRSFSVCEGTDVELDPEDFLYDTSRYESSFEWLGPNGFQSSLPKPFLQDLVVEDSGDYVLTVNFLVDENIITSKYTINIKIGKRLTFAINGNDTICKNGLTFLTSDTLNPQFSYRWSNNKRDPFISVSEAGEYKLFITNAYGCIDTATFYLTVIDPPEAIIEAERIICKNNSARLISKNQSDSYIYNWSTGETTPEINVDEPGRYYLTITNFFGCKDTTSIKVVAYPNLKVEISGDTVICSPGALELSSKIEPYDDSLDYKYIWSTGDSTSKINVTRPGQYILHVTIENNCSFSDTINVKLSTKPKLNVNVPNEVKLCEGETLTVDLTETEPDVTYYWSDGVKNFPRHIKETGLYQIIAENAISCTTKYDILITFADKPDAEIIIKDEINICNADSLTLSAFPKDSLYSYLWLINGSVADTLVVKQSGLYTLIVFNENGCADTTSMSVSLGKGLPVNIIGNLTGCEGDTKILTANVSVFGSEDNNIYLWSNGLTTKQIEVNQSGVYSVIVTHISGCIGYDTVTVKLYEIPEISLNLPSPQIICQGDVIEIGSDTIINGWQYIWQDGSNRNPRIFDKAGIYKMYVINGGTCRDSAEIEVIVSKMPEVKIIPDSNTKLCDNSSIILMASIKSDEYTYKWSDGSSGSTLEVSEPGLYKLETSDIHGCKFLDSIEITKAKIPTLELSSSSVYICDNDSVTLFANGIFKNLVWSTNENTDEIKIDSAGVYYAYAFSEDGCFVLDSITVKKSDEEVIVHAKNIDFGAICPTQILEKFTVITNESSIPIEIIDVAKPNINEFTEIDNIIGMLIPPGASLEISYKFSPLQNGKYNDKIKIYFKQICLDSLEISLNGESNFLSTISIPDLVVEAGSRFCIPINYEFDCTDTVNLNSGAIIKLSVNAEYFVPDSVSFGKIIKNEVKYGIRYIEIRFDNLILTTKTGVLLYLCCNALIGYDSTAVIHLNQFIWDENIAVNVKNGTIRNEACVIDLRHIKFFKPTSLKIVPNPIKEMIKINVISEEKGIFVIELVNSTGMILYKEQWNRNENDESEIYIEIPADEYPSGIYNLRLLSPWNITSSKIIIIK